MNVTKYIFFSLFYVFSCINAYAAVRSISNNEDVRGINDNFDKLDRQAGNAVTKTGNQTITGAKTFVLLEISTLTCSSCTFTTARVIGYFYASTAVFTGNITATSGTYSGALSATTLDTGQGANELYDMNQNVQTSDSVTFNDVTASGEFIASVGTTSAPSHTFTGDTDVGMYQNGANVLALQAVTVGININGNSGQAYPTLDNAFDWGRSANRWSTIFAANGTINTSSLAMKRDVHEITEPEIMLPRAIKFKWKDKEGKPDDREYIGFAADDLPLEAHPLNPDGSYNMRDVYTNAVIGMLLAETKRQQKQIQALEQRIEKLEKK